MKNLDVVKNKTYLLLALILTILFYRDFLNTYRMMLLDDFFAYYHYQNLIIYYETGNKEFQDNLPMNMRFVGLFLQYIIYKTIPCFSLTNIPVESFKNPYFECSTFSLAFLNYILKILIIVSFFYYMKETLKRNGSETVVSIILCFVFLSYIESYTFDRLTIFYLLIILINLNNKVLSFILILLSFLVNEKVLVILGPLLFFKIFFYKETKYKGHFIFACISLLLYFALYFTLKNFFGYSTNDFYSDASIERLFLSIKDKSHISNSILPLIFSTIPYLIYFFDRKKRNLKFSPIEILILIPLILLAYGGGNNNIGRYVMHSFVIWLPLMSCQISYYLKFHDKK